MFKNRKIWINVLIGFGILSIPILTSPDLGSTKNLLNIPGFQRDFLGYSLLLMFFYLNYHWLVPSFYATRKYYWYFAALIVCLFLISYLPSSIIDRLDLKPSIPIDLGANPSTPPTGPPTTISIFNVRDTFIIQFTMVILLSFLLRLDDQVKEIKNEKLKAEVNYLKAQINPHFLFNTLNSIYALALKKSEKAPAAILKLSEIMRYVVTKSDSEKVALTHEINYILDYIELQKLRIGKNVELDFEINGLPGSKSITPIILVNYIENAFKYGVNPDKPSKISIHISMDENGVELQVNNRVTVKQSSFLESTEGGNLNTKRRLDYFYPNKHRLEIDQSQSYHSVKLYLELV